MGLFARSAGFYAWVVLIGLGLDAVLAQWPRRFNVGTPVKFVCQEFKVGMEEAAVRKQLTQFQVMGDLAGSYRTWKTIGPDGICLVTLDPSTKRVANVEFNEF